MLTSKATMLILTEVFIILGFLIAALIVAVLYYRKQALNTVSDITESSATKKSASKGSQENSGETIDSRANDAWKLKEFIEQEIKACSSVYTSLCGKPIPDSIPPGSDKKLITIFVRHTYLKAELDAIEFRNNPGPFWEVMTPALLEICVALPSDKVKTTIKSLKRQLEKYQKESQHLHAIERTFFALQKLLRESFSSDINALFLPLAEEMELLNSDTSSDTIINHYKEVFAALENKIEQAGNNKPNTNTNTNTNANSDIESLNQITNNQASHIETLEEFLSELYDQNTLPSKQLGKYQNFILNMKEQVLQTEAYITTLINKLTESEMCTQFLESELESAQEAVKTLMENIEEDDRDKSSETEKIQELEKLVERFTRESRDMLISIQMLQDENTMLKNKRDGKEILDGEGL